MIVVTPIQNDELSAQGTYFSHLSVIPKDEIMINLDLQFCQSAAQDKTLLSSLSLFRGTTSNTLNSIIKLNLEQFSETYTLHKRYPSVDLQLKHIYGFEVLKFNPRASTEEIISNFCT